MGQERNILDDEIKDGSILEDIVHEDRRKGKNSKQDENNKRGKDPHNRRVAVWVKEEVLKYESELKELQIELLKMQNHVKDTGQKSSYDF